MPKITPFIPGVFVVLYQTLLLLSPIFCNCEIEQLEVSAQT